jgi:putative ATP-dependent endonuclease of the OLD family
MKLSELTLKNYRSFNKEGVSLTFPDIPYPISIVGYNNSGKSNIINGIVNACGYKPYGYHYSENDFYFKEVSTKAEVTLQFNESFNIPTIYPEGSDKKCFGCKLELKVDEDGSIQGFSHALDEKLDLIVTQERIKSRGLPVLMGKHKEKINLFYIDYQNLSKHLKISSSSLLGKAMEEIKRDFKKEDNIVKNVKDENISRNDYFNKLLDFIETNLLKTPKFTEFITSVENQVKKQLFLSSDSINITFSLPKSDEIYDSMEFMLSDNKTKPPIPLEQLGEGFKALLIIAILRTLLKTDEGGKILILEEPETYLHEHFQEYFYNILCDLAKKNQVIYTTHSKKFVNIFVPESIIRVENPDFLCSKIIQNKSPKIDYPDEINGFKFTDASQFPKYLRTLEPNIGNLIFASKVIIVEGPHDLLAYKYSLSQIFNFEANNTAILAAWGKDPIISLIQLCQRYQIAFYVIHDWDISNSDLDIYQDPRSYPPYSSLPSEEKSQFTKNFKIASLINDKSKLHHNKLKLESVLGIKDADKGAISVVRALENKSVPEIMKTNPGFINQSLLDFLKISIP